VIVLPDERARDRLLERLETGSQALQHDAEGPSIRDPSGNALVLAVA
jgi:hypothetical protein